VRSAGFPAVTGLHPTEPLGRPGVAPSPARGGVALRSSRQHATKPRPKARGARDGLSQLRQRVERLSASGGLGDHDIDDATTQFNAMCQGLATTELRNPATLEPQPARGVANRVRGTAARLRHDMNAAARRAQRLRAAAAASTFTAPLRAVLRSPPGRVSERSVRAFCTQASARR
jgi:hypothetical protein